MYSEQLRNEVQMVLVSKLSAWVVRSGISNKVQSELELYQGDIFLIGHNLTFTLSKEDDTEEGFRGYVIYLSENGKEEVSKEAVEAFDYYKWDIMRLLRDLVFLWAKIRRPDTTVNNYVFIDSVKSLYQSSLSVIMDNLTYGNNDLQENLEDMDA